MGALTTDEQGYQGIAVVTAALLPLCHHAQQPAVEVQRPFAERSGHTPRQSTDMVGLTVPPCAMAEEVADGVVVGNHRRADIQFHVDSPCHAYFPHLFKGDASQLPPPFAQNPPRFAQNLPTFRENAVGTLRPASSH